MFRAAFNICCQMKKYSFGLLFLMICSCSNHVSVQSLVTGKLTYSAFTWHFNPGKDTFETYIGNYLSIDSSGKFIGMKHDMFMGNAKYFSGTINDSLRKRLDSVLSISGYERNFIFSDETARMYDGFTYSIEYRNRDSLSSFILFVPPISPSGIRYVELALDSVIANAATNTVDSFSIAAYKTKLEEKVIASGIKMPKFVPANVKFKNQK